MDTDERNHMARTFNALLALIQHTQTAIAHVQDDTLRLRWLGVQIEATTLALYWGRKLGFTAHEVAQRIVQHEMIKASEVRGN